MERKTAIIVAAALIAVALISGFAAVQLFKPSAEEKWIRMLWAESDPNTVEAMSSIISAFEDEHPDIKVKPEYVAWGDLVPRLYAAVAAGTEPEIMGILLRDTISLADEDLLLPLDDVIEDLGEDRLMPSVREMLKYEDHYYGILTQTGAAMLYYRIDWFEEKGLDPPTTWDEFLAAAQALTEDLDGDGDIDRYGVTFSGTQHFAQEDVCIMMAHVGGKFFTEDFQPDIDNPKTIEMLEFYKEIHQYAPPGWIGYDYLDRAISFINGEAAMVPFWGRMFGYVETYNPDLADPSLIGCVDWPYSVTPFTQMDTDPTFVIPANARHAEEAKEFLKFMLSDWRYVTYCQSVPGHLNPAFTDVAESDEYWDNDMLQKWKPLVQKQIDTIAAGTAWDLIMFEWKREDPTKEVVPIAGKFFGTYILADMGLKVALGDMTPQEAAEWAQAQALAWMETL